MPFTPDAFKADVSLCAMRCMQGMQRPNPVQRRGRIDVTEVSTIDLGERSRGFALYLYPEIQGIIPSGLQKAGVGGVSHKRRKMPVSQMRIYTSSVGRRHYPRRINTSTAVNGLRGAWRDHCFPEPFS